MNAIRHDERENSVLTNEAIEVHLSYLRTGLEAVQTELPKLRQKIETLDEKLSEKIDQANKDRAAADAVLGEKIDQANRDRAAGDAALGEKIDKLAEVVMKMQGSQEGLKWFIASVAIIVSGISIARTLAWI
jgi:chromosome segregation ATPase